MELGAYEIMASDSVERFIRSLKKSPGGAVFNPWWEIDKQNDTSCSAPAVRRKQLAAYLNQRLGKARLIVIGEALGYRGGHFSGIPMTSERILLGKKENIVAALSERRSLAKAGERRNLHGSVEDGGRRPPLQIIAGVKARRTSKPRLSPSGFSEPTATIVWGSLLGLGLKPDEFVLWNAFPWHSFDPRRGVLSNRMPNKIERSGGLPLLKTFLDLFVCEKIVALGKIAESQLKQLNLQSRCVRHPASGGAKLFREQIRKIVKGLS